MTRLIFLILTYFFSVSALGASKSDLVLGDFNSSKKSDRLEIAADLKSYVHDLSLYVRNPTPREYDWINAQKKMIESASGNARSHQQYNLYKSVPFQLTKLKSLLNSLENSLSCVDSKIINLEMSCWTKSAFYFLNSTAIQDSICQLVKDNEIPDEALKLNLMNSVDGFSYDYGFYGRGILEYIVIPYMDMKATP